MERIDKELGLNQLSLIGIGILVGCDFLPNGIEKTGMKTAIKTMKTTDLK